MNLSYCLILAVLSSSVLPSHSQVKSTYFYLTRSWSPSFCKFDYHADRRGACQSASNRFTIHGLWFTCSNGGWPDELKCPGGAYDPEAIADLVPTLNQQWPSYGDKGNDNFWSHEWTCHGVCAGVADDRLSTQAAFFQEVLELDTAKTLNVLAEELELDTEMSTSDFVNEAASLLGAVPVVTCYYRSGKAYLGSVMSCLTDDLRLEDCQFSDESCDTATLTVPSWEPRSADESSLDNLDGTIAFGGVQRSLLRSDSRGCAISSPTCVLP